MLHGGRAVLLPVVAALALASCASPPASPGAPPNLARRGVASLTGGSGEPAVVTDGHLVPEGTRAADRGVRLQDPRSSVVVDLGTTRRVGALLLQATGSSVSFVEASPDGTLWQVVWRVDPVPGSPVARTRTAVLGRSVEARWLRVRPTSTGPVSVWELQAFENVPEAWPTLDRSHPDAPLPLWPGLTRERLAALYQALASLMMLVVGWSGLARLRPGTPDEDRLRRRILVGLALASLLAWPNLLNFHYHGFVHKWEVFHYYMGGKYLPELGYGSLYSCTAVVDAEDGVNLQRQVMRDLRDNSLVPASRLLERTDECRGRFSESRWRDFRKDTAFFREAMGDTAWLGVRRDHGFNGTPAWAVLGGTLAGLAPASPTQISVLVFLDVILVVALFVVLGRVFGLEAACIAAGFWGVNTLSVWGWTGGGFLRYDWVFWLVAGVAALRVGRPTLAGFALGYATFLRVFPAVAIAGLALKVAWDLASRRNLTPLREYVRFGAGVAVAGVLLLGSSSLMAGRTQIWSEFAENSRKHLGTASANLVGLPVFLAYDHDTRLEIMTDPLALDRHGAWKESLVEAGRRARPSHWAVLLAFVLLLAVAVRGAPDWVAAILGVGLMPVAFQLSSYYYCGFVVFAALWPRWAGVGLGLASLAWLTNVVVGLWPAADAQYAWLSLVTFAFAGGVTGALAWARRPTEPTPET